MNSVSIPEVEISDWIMTDGRENPGDENSSLEKESGTNNQDEGIVGGGWGGWAREWMQK